jgi:hypothetical protein
MFYWTMYEIRVASPPTCRSSILRPNVLVYRLEPLLLVSLRPLDALSSSGVKTQSSSSSSCAAAQGLLRRSELPLLSRINGIGTRHIAMAISTRLAFLVPA